MLWSHGGRNIKRKTVETIIKHWGVVLCKCPRKKKNPALLPIQIAYYTGLRIGEVCGLTWQDINLEEQYLTVRRSMRYNAIRHKMEIVFRLFV